MALNAAILSKQWVVLPNQRLTPFVSLNDTAAWWAFTNFSALVSNGWTVKYTCDGTTGPSSGADHTNRLASRSNFTTQGAAAGNAQSFFVVTNTEGVDLVVCYQGATNDVLRISYSIGGLFTPAGTSNQQPTATDETVVSSGNSIVNATASLDRVMTVWTSADTKQWSMALCRNNAIVNIMGLERVSDLTASGVFTVPYVGYRLTSTVRDLSIGSPVGGISGTAVGATGHVGIVARVFTAGSFRALRAGGGELILPPAPGNATSISNSFNATPPALQASVGSPLFPLYWMGEKALNLDGFLGFPVDWWSQYTSSLGTPAIGTFIPGYEVGDTPGVSPLRTNWLVALGPMMIRPWLNSDTSFQTS